MLLDFVGGSSANPRRPFGDVALKYSECTVQGCSGPLGIPLQLPPSQQKIDRNVMQDGDERLRADFAVEDRGKGVYISTVDLGCFQ